MSIGDRIIFLRERKGWSQRELARRIDLNYAVMNRIEKGTRPITDSEIIKLADVLDTTTDYLLGYSNSNIKEPVKNETFDDPDLQIAFKDASDFSEEARRQTIDFINYLKQKEKAKGRKTPNAEND
ncbi:MULTISPECIES: helix-turn-helix domain-containing protein [Bacillus]|uniref:helix-turn-helix domain-containing protein n=1 Tax=Bacillus TaxID=1386 RepID=UPI000DEFFDDE|nr:MULTISPECIES: helix-turn-helix transcriptional regulator [Bacillus subtilis group]MBR0008499.1 helix-turn-helix transcriptional regulator [Bacillus subtilis]MCI4168861.1 helix-turn-helix domain-containing protein [Bacillus spizizenii]MCY8280146.1 helix-turn-helix domain-containing protein [Bacillus inaquosorum]MCY8753441.1 helix-turn-helix domain-containing protein [Bacillus inaquosorum]MCY9343430.1 helix-turn-helix domain-containing protein [Bacillus inaquosorum]